MHFDWSQISQELIHWGYPLLFFFSLVEGLNIMFIGGFLAAQGYFNLYAVMFVLFLGDIGGDLIWYGLGRWGGRRFVLKYGRCLRITKERLDKVENFIHRHGGKALLMVKFTTGLCLITLVTSGVVKMRFKKFFIYDFIGSVGWSVITVLLGYLFGASFVLLKSRFESASLLLTVALLVGVGLVYFIRSRVKIRNFANDKRNAGDA